MPDAAYKVFIGFIVGSALSASLVLLIRLIVAGVLLAGLKLIRRRSLK